MAPWGIWFIPVRRYISQRKREILLSIVSLAFALAIAEGVLRIPPFSTVLREKHPPLQDVVGDPHTQPATEDYLGWITKENYEEEVFWEGCQSGTTHYTTTRDGFRVFGSTTTNKRRLFVIGDSFTNAFTVSDGETYYDYMAKNAEVEMFAYGCPGYGSLQEYLILDRFIDSINPDIIVWQFCSNDLMDNDPGLEVLTNDCPCLRGRAYLVDGRIQYVHLREERSWPVRSLLLLRMTLDALRALKYTGVYEKYIHCSAEKERAIDTTTHIMRLVRERARARPIVAFTVDRNEAEFSEISQACGIEFILGVPKAIHDAKAKGVKVDCLPSDPHWNAAGHRIAGEVILRYLKARNAPYQTNKETSPITGKSRVRTTALSHSR